MSHSSASRNDVAVLRVLRSSRSVSSTAHDNTYRSSYSESSSVRATTSSSSLI